MTRVLANFLAICSFAFFLKILAPRTLVWTVVSFSTDSSLAGFFDGLDFSRIQLPRSRISTGLGLSHMIQKRASRDRPHCLVQWLLIQLPHGALNLILNKHFEIENAIPVLRGSREVGVDVRGRRLASQRLGKEAFRLEERVGGSKGPFHQYVPRFIF